jgi:hypothetical protein
VLLDGGRACVTPGGVTYRRDEALRRLTNRGTDPIIAYNLRGMVRPVALVAGQFQTGGRMRWQGWRVEPANLVPF